jgi:MFS family permease
MIFPAISERASVRHRAQFTFFVSCVAALGGFLFGYDLAIISGAQIFLRSQFHLSPGQFGFAVSSALMGCIAGPILGTKLCDRFGRKPTLIIAGVLFLIGAAGTALAQSIVVFNVFRIEGGVGVGLASLASPMYIAEAAPARRRGALTLLYQLAIVVGCLVATIVSYYLANYLSPHIRTGPINTHHRNLSMIFMQPRRTMPRKFSA